MIDLNELQNKAEQNGFELKPFQGFALIEVDSGADLYFENLNDVNNYIDACDLNEHELRKHYGVDQSRDEMAMKIANGNGFISDTDYLEFQINEIKKTQLTTHKTSDFELV